MVQEVRSMCKNKSELDKLVAKYRKCTALKKKLEKQLSELSEDITEYVISKGVKGGTNGCTLIVLGDDYKVSYITSSKTGFDNDKVKALLGDSLPEYQKVTVYHKLNIN